MTDDDPRLATAEAFLQEAVYRSRAKQAAITGLAGASLDAELAVGQCGLGKEAVVELDLSAKGLELATELWTAKLEGAELERARDTTRAWVRAQDALDRDRNHFLKAFRREHGPDRRAWSPDELAAYDAGLAEINDRVDAARRASAHELLG